MYSVCNTFEAQIAHSRLAWNFICGSWRNLLVTVGIRRSSESWSMQFFTFANKIRPLKLAGHPAQYLFCRFPIRTGNASRRMMQIPSDLTALTRARELTCRNLIKFSVTRDQLRSCRSFPIPLSLGKEENDVLSVTINAGTNLSSTMDSAGNKFFLQMSPP